MPARSRRVLWALVAVSVASHVLLAAGLFGPSLTIIPRMGRLTKVASALGILDPAESLSIVGSVARLFGSGNPGIAIVLALASVVTPIAKLVVVNKALSDALRGAPVTPWLARLSHVTKYSLVDVLVVAILIVSARSFPGGTEVVPRWGLWCFSAAAVLPWIVVKALSPRRETAGPG